MSQKPIKPTESELEILQVLWQKGKATVREVHEELSHQGFRIYHNPEADADHV